MTLLRAGFEPFRGCAIVLANFTPTARLKTGAVSSERLAGCWARRVFRPTGLLVLLFYALP